MYKDILTNPLEHRSNRYIYCVYAFHQSNPALNTLEGIRATIDRIQNPSKLFRASLVGRLDPNIAEDRFGLYEEINQTGMFGDIGFVVGLADDAQVRIAWNCDLASGLTEDELRRFVAEHDGKVRGPHCLLTQTVGIGDLNYNEMIINGHPTNKIQGVCYKGDKLTQIKANLLAAYVKHICGSKVPIMVLANKESTPTDEVKMIGRTLGEIIASILGVREAREEFYGS